MVTSTFVAVNQRGVFLRIHLNYWLVLKIQTVEDLFCTIFAPPKQQTRVTHGFQNKN